MTKAELKDWLMDEIEKENRNFKKVEVFLLFASLDRLAVFASRPM